jgi:hypothetical protein
VSGVSEPAGAAAGGGGGCEVVWYNTALHPPRVLVSTVAPPGGSDAWDAPSITDITSAPSPRPLRAHSLCRCYARPQARARCALFRCARRAAPTAPPVAR